MNRTRKVLFLMLVLFIILCPALTARTGGAGGGGSSHSGSSSGSGGDGLGMLIYWIIISIPFPYNMIVLAAIVAAFFLYGRGKRQESPYNRMQDTGTQLRPKGLSALQSRDPSFSESEFLSKARTAFANINAGWAKKDMSASRRYISDGVYQRFHIQFEMMNLLEQTNRSENIQIRRMGIDKVETDGYFDAISVQIQASSTDYFQSGKYPELNDGGYEEYTEYWTFLKKRGTETKDIYRSNACPSCGGELPADMGDVSRCPYCKRLSNTGEYDWVLSEITQADDYLATSTNTRTGKLNREIARLTEENDDFSVQLLEDRVSNGYLRILAARISGKPEAARRFASDAVYEDITTHPFETGMVLNRLYLNYVSLIAAGANETANVLAFAIKETSQRVRTGGKKAELIDPRPVSRDRIVILERERNRSVAAGSVYSYSCPSCGGEIHDSLETSCSYCGNPFNSVSFDWVITHVMNASEYRTYLASKGEIFNASSEVDLAATLYKVRDYAINNLMITIGADGVFKDEEIAFAEKAAKKWGYNVAKIQALFQMAQSGRLVIRMPDDPKDRARIYRLMLKAASSDNDVSPEERRVLDYVKTTFGIESQP